MFDVFFVDADSADSCSCIEAIGAGLEIIILASAVGKVGITAAYIATKIIDDTRARCGMVIDVSRFDPVVFYIECAAVRTE